jgi:hypothetical protein
MSPTEAFGLSTVLLFVVAALAPCASALEVEDRCYDAAGQPIPCPAPLSAAPMLALLAVTIAVAFAWLECVKHRARRGWLNATSPTDAESKRMV